MFDGVQYIKRFALVIHCAILQNAAPLLHYHSPFQLLAGVILTSEHYTLAEQFTDLISHYFSQSFASESLQFITMPHTLFILLSNLSRGRGSILPTLKLPFLKYHCRNTIC